MDLSLLSYGAKVEAINMDPQPPLSPTMPDTDHSDDQRETHTNAEPEEAEAVVMDPKVAVPGKSGVKYRECMRNHAAALGGLASDGCGEFMPVGDSLSCAACGCHRSFHRREVDARERVHHNRRRHRVVHSPPPSSILLYNPGPTTPRWDQKMIANPAPLQAHVSSHHRQLMQRNVNRGVSGMMSAIDLRDQAEDRRSETPEREEVGSETRTSSGSKRFRTKFTAEQKERMMEYAERAGWRIHRQDDVALSDFCAAIGVKRNVLKVWMHNNKAAAAAALRRRETFPAAPLPPSPSAVDTTPPQHAGV